MTSNEPNWTYRDLLSCTLAEVDAQIGRASDAHERDDALAKACGAISLWLRLTDDSRNPEDTKLLMERFSTVLPLPKIDNHCAFDSNPHPRLSGEQVERLLPVKPSPS